MDHSVLIDQIYEAAVLPEKWPDVLDLVSARISGNGGFLFAISNEYESIVCSPRLNTVRHELIHNGWGQRDPRLPRALALNHPGFINDGDLFSDEEIATDDVYNNFHRPHGIGYMAATLIPNPTGDFWAFAFERHQDNGPVPRQIVSYLDTLRPHFARAVLLSARLAFERAQTIASALHSLGLPGAVLRGAGKLIAANESFHALIPTLFQDRALRVGMTDRAADQLLAAALETTNGDVAGVKSIPLAATEAHCAMIVHLVPVRGAARDIFTQSLALLVVTPVDRAAVPTAEVLQGLFDLTPAEARVARAISQAKTIDEISVSSGVSRETVRTHLRAVLFKTGLGRQIDLVSLLAGKAIGR